MVEIRERQVEAIEKTGGLKRYKSGAKSIRGLVLGLIQKFSRGAKEGKVYSSMELEKVFTEVLNKFNEFYPERIVQNEITILDGWKGKDEINVYKGFDNDFRIKEHIKDKDSGEVTERVIEIKKDDLNRILWVIKDLEIGSPYKCYYIAKKLGYEEWKDLWRERGDYFKLYYYPIKVAEALNLIDYSGKGQIIRLK